MFLARFQYKYNGYQGAKKVLNRKGYSAIHTGLRAICQQMKRSMKDAPRDKPSPPGTPPHSHRRKRNTKKYRKRLKDTIRWGAEFGMKGVVGPSAEWARQIGKLHEHGGTQQVTVYQIEEDGKYLTRTQATREHDGKMTPFQRRLWRKREKGRRTRKSRGYNPASVEKNERSRHKMEAGMRAMSEREINAIQEYYDLNEGRFLKRKKVAARYPKRPFAVLALVASLQKISSSLRGR